MFGEGSCQDYCDLTGADCGGSGDDEADDEFDENCEDPTEWSDAAACPDLPADW